MKKIQIIAVSIALTTIIGCSSHQIKLSSQPTTHYKQCKVSSEAEIAALFDRWNRALQTGDPRKVTALYAEKSILLPTVSDKPRLTPAEKEEYFAHFLEKRPSGRIDLREIVIGCDMAVDSGLYTFTFAKTGEVVSGRYSFTYRWNGSKWLIISHHSSVMPESYVAPSRKEPAPAIHTKTPEEPRHWSESSKRLLRGWIMLAIGVILGIILIVWAARSKFK